MHQKLAIFRTNLWPINCIKGEFFFKKPPKKGGKVEFEFYSKIFSSLQGGFSIEI